uniref:Retrotransposon protein, putative, unclassified n=1 Tax=Oryza sativa subsp. japonica TaxID=39947 RepID=Q339Y6_ORYSJ|nr:retrotransposon protein, putative, unclassified [Oryza sativa Japonica Group]
MPGLSRSIVECRLPVKPGVRPYQQPPRRCKAYMLEPVKAEVKRLYDAGFIHPYRYAEWVSNIVPVIKKNGKVRVCIDFRDLNKATRKDEYPMPVADQLVNAASGHEILSFMDGNAGYNQIFMAEEDIHMTAFRCPGAIGLFEWVVMTFGLKSAGATYQRAMNYIFHDLIGWLVEVYIDDVVVKSKEIENHIADLRKVFEKTRKYGLKMNPIKCAFGVSAGQFLGFLVHERGIEITQMSVNAIKKIQPPEDKTELQELIGKINFVRRFISNLSGRLEPFTPLLRLKADQEYTWGAEQQKAFDSIKEYLSSPPVSIPPQKGMAFRLYLSAGEKSIGSVLIRELEEKERVVFYLSRRLLDAETRVGKWIFALTEFDLRYESPKAIKGQAIADFIVDHRDDSIGSVEIVPWSLFFDGSVCTHGCGIGLVIISPLGASFEFAYTIKPDATNNQAEYEAVLKGLQLLKEVEADAIEIMGDSLLVICQLAGEYECKNDTLMVYNEKCQELMNGFRLNPSQSASRKLRYKALKYTLLDDELYYRTIDGVLLKCLSADQAKVAIGEVPPYKLVYGHEAVLPWEVRIGSRRMDLHDQLTADEYYNLMADEKEDLVQSRLRALAKVTKDKERIARHYNKKVVPKSFSEGELVWKLILPIGTRDNKFGKWSPNWEGPFQIHKVVSKGAYREVYGRALNGKYLKKCYPSVWVHT